MRRLGDKIGAKLLAEQAGVPVAPWSGGPVHTIEQAHEHAAAIGFPLMIKATSGGGGRGIRKVDDAAGLAEAFDSARAEGLKAFGDATVFMERVVTGARHVEVQLIADSHGTVWAVGVRDCSLQRRNQKVMEESHCIALTAEQDRDLRAAAVRLAEAAGYQNAGTVEFLFQPDEQLFAFLEVNTRLQVEHPVTELTTGLDLVKLQIHVAGGGRLVGEPPPSEGYAIEARLNAEDPQRAFAPAPGTVETLSLPVGPGIRVDTGIAEGDVIPPEYDSMIAKVIAHGRDRAEALARLHRALAQMTVLVRGGTTNKSFLLDLLARPEIRRGEFDTAWLDRLTAADEHLPTRLADVALIAAVIDADDLQVERERAIFLGWASRGRPFVDVQVGREVEFRHGGRAYRVDVRRVGPSRYEIGLSGSSVTSRSSSVIVDVERLGRARSRLTIAGRSFAVVSSVQDTDHLVEVDGVAHRFSRDDAGIVRAPAAALVVGVDVAPDDIVEAGQRLAVVEAMKMELAITSPVSGRVRDVFVTRNVQVDAGTPLIRIEPLTGDAADVPMGATIDFAGLQRSPATDPLALAVDHLESIRAFMLGFDLEADRIRHMLDAISGDRGLVGADRALYVRHRLAIFDAFSDLCAVAREGRDPNADSDDAHVPREYFNSYLRSLDIEREGVPAWFGDALLRALAHYGVTRLDRSPELEESLLRIFCAHQRRDEQLPIVMALLDDQLDQPVSDMADDDDTDNLLRATLDRLIASTQRRCPAIAGMSRTVRHRRFDQPLVDQARVEVSASMKQLAAGLADADDDRAAKIDELVACPWPLVPILADDNLLATCQSPAPLLEVLTRRYYKIRDLDTPRVERVGEHEVCVAQYARPRPHGARRGRPRQCRSNR